MPSVSLNPTTAKPNTVVKVLGTTFPKLSAGTVSIGSLELATFITDNVGTFRTTITIPANQPAGYIPVTVTVKAVVSTNLIVPPQVPTPDPSLYAFFDDFSGTTLNTAKWGKNYKPSGLPSTQHDKTLSSVSGGYLRLTAVKKADGLWYSSSVDTKTTYTRKYGIYEARIKIPKGQGLWPAGPWSYNDATGQEIDGMEIPQSNKDADHDVSALHCTVHWSGAQADQDGTPIRTGIDLSADFHVYAFEWRSIFIKWVLDGKVVKTFTDAAHIPTVALPMILDLGVSGWAGPTDLTTPNPAEMLVDWAGIRP